MFLPVVQTCSSNSQRYQLISPGYWHAGVGLHPNMYSEGVTPAASQLIKLRLSPKLTETIWFGSIVNQTDISVQVDVGLPKV